MLATVLACGVFGTLIGTQKVLFFVNNRLAELTRPEDVSLAEQRVRILLLGMREASNCLSLSLLFVLLICLLVAIGYRRFPLPNPAAVAR
jgi:hypothetical protein